MDDRKGIAEISSARVNEFSYMFCEPSTNHVLNVLGARSNLRDVLCNA